jgi:osmotically inducible lipoprotein OsmB
MPGKTNYLRGSTSMEVAMMNTKLFLAGGLLLLGMAGCADMTSQEKCTAGGALLGGVAGSLLTHQSGIGTVGGAAVGGVVGHEVGKGGCP